MKPEAIKTEERSSSGSSAARRMRCKGKVPGILYGHGEEAVKLALDGKQLADFLQTSHHLVRLQIGERQESALVKEVQYDTWGKEILHADFARVAMDELVTVAVQIIPHGTPKATQAGAVLEQVMHAVEVTCKADEIPDIIRVEVGHLELDGKIFVKDLALPAGVKAAADADDIVFIVQETHEEAIAAPVAAAEGAAAAEPELIRPVKPAEDAEGEETDKEKEKK
jgi:large subunit ribosomal protein L25